MTAGFKWWQIPSVCIRADNFFILKKPVIPTATTPAPPGSVHQLLLSVCPLLPLKLRIYKRSILRGQKYLWARPNTGTGCEARITSREGD